MKGTLANIVDPGYSAGADLRIIMFIFLFVFFKLFLLLFLKISNFLLKKIYCRQDNG